MPSWTATPCKGNARQLRPCTLPEASTGVGSAPTPRYTGMPQPVECTSSEATLLPLLACQVFGGGAASVPRCPTCQRNGPYELGLLACHALSEEVC